jgi:hypothetical protein
MKKKKIIIDKIFIFTCNVNWLYAGGVEFVVVPRFCVDGGKWK